MSDKLIDIDSLNRDSDSCVDESEVSVKPGSGEVVKANGMLPTVNENEVSGSGETVKTKGGVSRTAAKKNRCPVFYKCCEVTFLVSVMVVIVGLFTIPTVFWILQDNESPVEVRAS